MLESTEYRRANVHVCCTYWWASASASSPGEHSTWGLCAALSQCCKTAAGTLSTGKINAVAPHWGAIAGEAMPASGPWPTMVLGQTRELCYMSSLWWGGFHCSIVERREIVSQGGNSPPHWRGMTGSSCTGSLAPVPPGPAALPECRKARCCLESGWGQRWVPGHQRAQLALLGQRPRKSFLGRVVLWLRTNLAEIAPVYSWLSSRFAMATLLALSVHHYPCQAGDSNYNCTNSFQSVITCLRSSPGSYLQRNQPFPSGYLCGSCACSQGDGKIRPRCLTIFQQREKPKEKTSPLHL